MNLARVQNSMIKTAGGWPNAFAVNPGLAGYMAGLRAGAAFAQSMKTTSPTNQNGVVAPLPVQPGVATGNTATAPTQQTKQAPQAITTGAAAGATMGNTNAQQPKIQTSVPAPTGAASGGAAGTPYKNWLTQPKQNFWPTRAGFGSSTGMPRPR